MVGPPQAAPSSIGEPTALRQWSASASGDRDRPFTSGSARSNNFAAGRRTLKSEPPSPELVDYLADSSFSAHKHATESLLRCLPVLPAHDADTALAALDATEADLRFQRRQMQDSEDAARDRLRRSMQSSVSLQAGTVIEADRADEVRLAATGAGRNAVNGLKKLVAPLRVAKTEKEELTVAANLLSLLAEDKALDVVQSAEALGRAWQVLSGDGNSAVALFEGDEVVLSRARARIAEQIDDFSSDLDDLVVRGASSSDAAVVRMCLDAAAKLSPELEARTVKAAVDAIVDCDETDVISRSSGLVLGSSSSRNRSHSRGPEFFPGIDAVVAERLAPFRDACHDAIESAAEFCGTSANMFPDRGAACVLALERLLFRVIVLPADGVIKEFELALLTARESELASGSDRLASDGQEVLDTSQGTRLSRTGSGSYETVNVAETRFLDTVAAIACIVSYVDNELCRVAAAGDVSEALCRSAIDSACSLVRSPLSMFVDLETKWLNNRMEAAFEEIARVPLAPEKLVVDASYHRCRVSYLNIIAKLPQTSHVVVAACLASVHRCISALVAHRPAKADISKGQFLVGKFLRTVVHNFVRIVTSLVDRLHFILPDEAAVAEHPDIWTRGASPLASVCKTIRHAHAGTEAVDTFLMSLEVPASKHFASVSQVSREWKEQIQRSAPSPERRAARAALRRGLEPVVASMHRGIQSAVAAVARRLIILISGGGDTAAQYASPWDQDGVHREGADPEPSLPFVDAAAFLEQELGVVHANLPGHTLGLTVSLLISATYEAVLARWDALSGTVPAEAGRQMIADGRVIESAYERLASEESKLLLLSRYGLVFSTPRSRLGAVIESQLMPLADTHTLVELIRRRPDGSSAELSSLRRSLVSPADDSADET